MRRKNARSRVVTSVATALLVIAAMTVPLAAPAAANHGNCDIDVSPETDSNPLGQTHTVTAELDPATCDRDGGSITVNFDVDADVTNATYNPNTIDGGPGDIDLTCTIKQNDESCSVSYTRVSPSGTDEITGSFADEPAESDEVSKTWTSSAGSGIYLNVTPEDDENPEGSEHTLTATVRNASGGLVNNANVDFEILDGPNENFDNLADDADFRCTTTTGGTCTITYEDADNDPDAPDNVDTICGWIDTATGNSLFDPDGAVADGGDCDAEAISETEDSAVSGTDTFGNDATDNVMKEWTGVATGDAPELLDVELESDTNAPQTTHTLTATVRDDDGDLVSGAEVDFEIMTGPNDDLDAGDPDRTCTTGSSGTCTVTYTDGATNPAAPNNVDTICGWLDTDDDSVFNVGGTVSDGGDCDAEAVGETEDSPVSGTDSFGNDATDKVTKTWSTTVTGNAQLLNVTPESDVNAVRTQHTLTATARDDDGDLVSGADVDFEIVSGPNDDLDSGDPDLSCTTGSNGSCTVSYTDGTNDPVAPNNVDTICGWLDTDDDDVFDDDGAINDGGACDVEDVGETDDSAVPGTDTFGNDATDTVAKTWGEPVEDVQLLNVVPESDVNEPRTSHALVATARDGDGDTVAGATIDFEVTDGPNENLDSDADDADLTCTTASNGTCAVSYADVDSSSTDNFDVICAWLDTDGDSTFNEAGDINDGGACDVENVSETDDSDLPGRDTFGNDASDAVTKTWGTSNVPEVCRTTAGAMIGTAGADLIEGTPGDDVICALAGNDTVLGRGGNDLILGGAGNDVLRGGTGDDFVRAGRGGDAVYGGGGGDQLRGKGGDDFLSGGRGRDFLLGGRGDDSLHGGRGVDGCNGGAGRDTQRHCEGRVVGG